MKHILILLNLVSEVLGVIPVMAQQSPCSAVVSPASVEVGGSRTLSFVVTNSSAGEIGSIQIRNSDGEIVNVSAANADGWNTAGATGDYAYFNGANLSVGATQSFEVEVVGVSEGSVSWSVAATDRDGAGLGTCSGSLDTAVTPPLIYPVISGGSLTVGNSSANLTWNTDVAATGVVNYGTTSGYGSSVSTTSGTNHSVTISGLSASTTYHYQIQAISSGTTSTTDATFTTSAASVTTTTTTTVTNTVTENVTVTKIITDTTAPVISKLEIGNQKYELGSKVKVFEEAPLVTGSVSDDRGVAKVEYRIKDLETAWSSASLEGSVGAKKMDWEFLPPISLDGTYVIEIRGVDVFGNISAPKTVEFVIDQMLPTVGGGVISYGALPLYAVNGVVSVLSGREYEVVLYEAGGADEVTIEFANHKFSNSQMRSHGLWRSQIKFDEVGNFTSKVKAVDGAGNETSREWVAFRVLPNSNQAGELYYLDPTTKRFGLWEASEYGQTQGEIGWYVPAGEYYVKNNNLVSQRIVMESDGWISGEWSFGELRMKWWEKLLRVRRLARLSAIQQFSESANRSVSLSVGREKWIGKKSLVYVGTPALPWYEGTKQRAMTWAEEQGAELVELVVQGEDDPKGEWLEKLEVGLLPQVYLINDRGDTVDYKEGVWER